MHNTSPYPGPDGRSERGGRRPLLAALVVIVVVALAGFTAACGDDNEGSGSGSAAQQSKPAEDTAQVDDGTVKAALEKAFYTEPKNVDPMVAQALKRASAPLTAEQSSLLKECMKKTTCDTGHGQYVVALADSFGDIPWRVQARMEVTAQCIQNPDCKQLIYTNGRANLQQSQANFRAMMAKKVDVIVAYFDFASAMTNLFRQAQRQGIVVACYICTMPYGDGESDGIQFAANMDTVGKDMADSVIKAVGKPGTAALFTGVPGNPTGEAWMKVAQQELEANGWKVGYKGNTSWTPAGELKAASAALAGGKKIDAIIYDGAGPTNLIRGWQRAGKKVPAIASFAPDNTYYEIWKSLGEPKDQYISNSQTWTGRVAVEAALARKAGQDVPGAIELPQPFVKTSDAMAAQVEKTLPLGKAYLPPTFTPTAVVKDIIQ